jgi:hypothetical protein
MVYNYCNSSAALIVPMPDFQHFFVYFLECFLIEIEQEVSASKIKCAAHARERLMQVCVCSLTYSECIHHCFFVAAVLVFGQPGLYLSVQVLSEIFTNRRPAMSIIHSRKATISAQKPIVFHVGAVTFTSLHRCKQWR